MSELTNERILEHFEETRGCLDECVYGDCLVCAAIHSALAEAAPKPKVVTRKWAEGWSLRFQYKDDEPRKTTESLIMMLRELGIEVEP